MPIINRGMPGPVEGRVPGDVVLAESLPRVNRQVKMQQYDYTSQRGSEWKTGSPKSGNSTAKTSKSNQLLREDKLTDEEFAAIQKQIDELAIKEFEVAEQRKLKELDLKKKQLQFE
ncbi:unnamed protein product [Orchesella dallaii]|uniref:Uncharacterized protein n=1 Tax=Orchesella dallaii TaxID=48710 RepID=A0ABP1QD88_9HEXA